MGKRILLGVAAAATLLTLSPAPASAHGDGDDYRSSRYGGYGSGYYGHDRHDRCDHGHGGGYRDRGYYGGHYSGGRGYYVPRRRTVRYRSASRYGCGDCGERFGSSYWLSYHRRHTACH